MRTFEQYIRESYDFRLGGKKRRGFKGCSFNQLEDGDKFYYKFFDDGEYKGERELKVWDISPAKPTDEKPDAVKSIRFSKVDEDLIYTLQLSEEDLESNAFSTDIELSSNRKRIYVWSTELLSEDDAYEIAYNAEMKESVDFRLGGKANKGNLVKTFRELEKGDEIYFYNVDLNKSECKKFKYTFDHYGSPSWQSKNSTEPYMFFSRTSGDVGLDSIGMTKERMSCSIEVSIVASNYYKIFSTVDLTEEEVIEKVSNMTKRGENKMYESVDFRLGGKANKGDYLHKKFEELEPGDSIYVYELTSDGKLTRANIFDYKKRRRSSDNSSSYFFMGEWRNAKLKTTKSILLSRDCYERSAFHSYKTFVWSTYEMTDEELAEFVNNKDNEMKH